MLAKVPSITLAHWVSPLRTRWHVQAGVWLCRS